MASSARWRYTRKNVPSLEKAITLLVVLVLAGLGGLFAWDMKRPPPASPFAVDDKLLSEAARPAEAVAANYLLPSNQNAKRTAGPTVVSTADLSERDTSLGRIAGQYKAKRAILANYEVAGVKAAAVAIDTGGPEWAFGLWSARKPAQAKIAGGAGSIQAWQGETSAGFWAGTYYVELSLEQPSASASAGSARETPAADPLAVLLGEVSRAYVPHGRPFAAEALLPAEGLKADSLRFAADAAFGVEPLKPAFVAEYEAEARVTVVTCGSADAARTTLKAALKALASTDPEGESAGTASPQIDAKGRAMASLADGRAIVLQAVDRFVITAVAGQAEQATALLEQVPQATPGGQVAAAAAVNQAKPKADGPLPKLQEADLSGPDTIRRFNADTLYEKIDGKAQLYLSYNFAELLFTTYTAGASSIDVYVYDMSQADNAFGIYKAEEGENAEAVEVGRGGYASGASIFFWKGKHYVNILAGGEEGHGESASPSGSRELAMKLAGAIAAQLPDAGQNLWAEQILPQADRTAGSFEFRKSDAFGLDFLKDVFSAQYKVGGKDLTLFVLRQPSQEKAEEILKQYEAFAGKYGKILGREDVAGAKVLLIESSGTYDVVFLKDKYFGGATAADDRDLAKSVVTKWAQDLGAAQTK